LGAKYYVGLGGGGGERRRRRRRRRRRWKRRNRKHLPVKCYFLARNEYPS
jgi:hypothetical protein